MLLAHRLLTELTEEEGALFGAIRPLVQNADCHFLAALTALVQSLLEGRTDCPISAVFGAGKTRAAAAMIGGLLVVDPTLKVIFFFLHCRASTRHCRSTTGILMRKKANYGRNSLEARKQPNKANTTKQHKHQTTAPPPGKFAKLGETR